MKILIPKCLKAIIVFELEAFKVNESYRLKFACSDVVGILRYTTFECANFKRYDSLTLNASNSKTVIALRHFVIRIFISK